MRSYFVLKLRKDLAEEKKNYEKTSHWNGSKFTVKFINDLGKQ